MSFCVFFLPRGDAFSVKVNVQLCYVCHSAIKWDCIYNVILETEDGILNYLT